MQNNDILCYICHRVIKNREEASLVGKDIITGKEKYRHRTCSPHGLPSRPRNQWKINPKTKIKESAKIYNRKKAKLRFKKDLNKDE